MINTTTYIKNLHTSKIRLPFGRPVQSYQLPGRHLIWELIEDN